jgi:hypothetical protein
MNPYHGGKMITTSQIKLGLTGAIMLIVAGSFSACADLPTASNGEKEPDRGNECIRIDDIIHCPPT